MPTRTCLTEAPGRNLTTARVDLLKPWQLCACVVVSPIANGLGFATIAVSRGFNMNRSTLRKKYSRVAVCVDKARNYGRGVLRGIAQYVETFGPWSLSVDQQAAGTFANEWLHDWQGDGILAYIDDAPLAEHLRASKIPTVELFAYRRDLKLPQVGNDDVAIGRLAAEHLLERRFTHFAFAGYPDEPWVERRQHGFSENLDRAGFDHKTFLCARRPQTMIEWEQIQQSMADWIRSLPKPIGVMACSDRHAQRVLDACGRACAIVPEEVAVIGVDNDEETCRLSSPPLTSVIENSTKIGYEAARLLDQLMKGTLKPKNMPPILVAPIGIATRRSTEVTAINDWLVADAVRFIREHACDGLKVETLVAEFGVSRSVFYERFLNAMNRSPHQEILRVQLEKTKRLLTETDFSLEKITELAGFQHPANMSATFKREVGMNPSVYRKQKG